MRPKGFNNEDSARNILEGYVVNYNFARPHLSLTGKMPAEQAGIEVKVIEVDKRTGDTIPIDTQGFEAFTCESCGHVQFYAIVASRVHTTKLTKFVQRHT